jgi:hypothetical protein
MLAGLGAAGMSWREAGELIASTPELAFVAGAGNSATEGASASIDGGQQR